jgi:hypothetical protein
MQYTAKENTYAKSSSFDTMRAARIKIKKKRPREPRPDIDLSSVPIDHKSTTLKREVFVLFRTIATDSYTKGIRRVYL